MTHSHKLSDKQLMLLSAASQRHDRLLALPEILKGAAARALVSKLLAGGLVEEITVSPADPYWRTSEDDQMIGRRITQTGLEAIGIEPDGTADADAGDTPQVGSSEPQVASSEEPAVAPTPRRQRGARSEPWSLPCSPANRAPRWTILPLQRGGFRTPPARL